MRSFIKARFGSESLNIHNNPNAILFRDFFEPFDDVIETPNV
nr:hypothetical protein [Pyrococcus sp. ST04]